MKRIALTCLASLLLTFSSASARADGETVQPHETTPPEEDANLPRRSGFTLELGLGGSFANIESDRESQQKFGLAPLSLSLGGFFNRDIALMFRATGSSIFGSERGQTTQALIGFYGPAVQYYPNDRFYIGAGVGLGLYATNNPALATASHPAFIESGLAFDARLGFVLIASKAHQLSIYTEVIPAKFDDTSALGLNLAVGYQFY